MRLHILGICGTFMAAVAHLARELGHEVTGSDSHIYPPMSDFLRESGIPVHEGWSPAVLHEKPDLVVIGNALSRGNPLVEAVLDAGLPYTSGAQWVASEVLPGREVIAIAGTHGKTTTSSLTAWMLECAGLEPGFLIGGIPLDFGVPARLGRGRPFVIEADEYDTAFFDKRSKFVHYRPTVAVLNNLEFDHADIFPDLDAIKTQFHHLLRTVPGRGTVVWNAQEPALADVLARGCWSRQVAFNPPQGAWSVRGERGTYEVETADGRQVRPGPALGGRHNALNAAAALAACDSLGADGTRCADALQSFTSVRRRLELLGSPAGISVYDDFAHHPTAIAATLTALRERAPGARVVAVLELRSNTMRAGVHRDTLGAALRAADASFVLVPPDLRWDAVSALTPDLDGRLATCPDTAALLEALLRTIRAGDQILIMSNGGFENLHQRLLQALATPSPPAA